MKIATWNVNGIRARQAQLSEWLARDRPDIVCLQELKAEVPQIPDQVKLEGYHAFWHGMRAYSGVSLQVRKGLFDAEPAFSHPDFDMEARIVQAEIGRLVLASVYVPNGGKDYEAKLQFMVRLAAWAKQLARDGRDVILCGDLNITRTDMDLHPTERKPGVIGSGRRSATSSTSSSAITWSTSPARSTRTTRCCSPGGPRGATCERATSDGASTTSSPRPRSPRPLRAAQFSPTSARAITRR
jgi:exodeoxyribonuclease III